MRDCGFLIGAAALGAALSALTAGQAAAEPLIVQRAVVPLAMNQQASAVESAVSRAAQQRHAPLSPRAFDGRSSRGVTAWIDEDLRYVDLDGQSSDGLTGNVLFGGDFALSSNFSLGLMFGYSLADVDTQFAAADGEFQSQSFLVGPYVSVGLGGGLFMDAFAAYSRSWYEITQAGVLGEPNSDRFLGGVGIGAAYDLGPVTLQPTVDLSISHDSQDGYVGSLGTPVASRNTTLFRGSAAAKVGQVFSMGNADINPWASAGLEFTSDNEGGNSVVGDTVSARVGAGVGVMYGPLEMSIEADAAGLGGHDFFDIGGRFTLSYVFY